MTTSFSNVNLSLEEYEALKQQISELKAENEKLKAERNQLCEKNKVRVVHKETIISKPVPMWSPSMLTCVETIKDELINFEDIEEEVKSEIEDKLKAEKKEADENLMDIGRNLTKVEDRLEFIEEAYHDLYKSYSDLLHRNLWQRITNKITNL